jgi:4-hydroxy-tetrahydrodipicolinate synthase
LVTPFKNGALDEAALQGLVERQIAAGSHGISVGGTTGEPAGMSLSERERVIELAVQVADGRLPVLAGSGSVNLDETLRLTRFAQGVGANAGLIITPYYVKPNQEGLYRFFAAVAAAAPDFPLVLYNIPGRAAVATEVKTLARLAGDYPNIVGVKHSVKDLDVVSWTLKTCGRDFKVFCGLESLTVPMLLLGGHGMIAATGNLLPREVARQYDLVKAGEVKEAVALHYHLLEINDSIFWDSNPIPLKTVMSMMGLIEKEWRPPLGPGSSELEARLKTMAEGYGLLEAAVA